MKILLLSADSGFARHVLRILQAAGHVVEWTDDEADAAAFLADFLFDAAIVDCGWRADPGDLVRLKGRPPILAVSGHRQAETIAALLDGGADDALAKPVAAAEFLARLRALQRRAGGHRQPLLVAGRLAFDPEARVALVDGDVLRLSAKLLSIFEALVSRPGRTLSKEQLLSCLYVGGADDPDIKIVDVFICKLRAAIRAASGGDAVIETIWGQGYLVPIGRAGAVYPALEAAE